jgi:hypothetical protein
LIRIGDCMYQMTAAFETALLALEKPRGGGVIEPTLLEMSLGLGVRFSSCEAEWRRRKQRQSKHCAVCTSVLYLIGLYEYRAS